MDLAKARKGDPRLLGQRRKEREARSRAFKAALERWLHKYSVFQVKQVNGGLEGTFKNADTEESIRG